MCDVFCPVCNARVIILQVACHRVTRHPVYGASLAVSFPHVVACTGCSLISELSNTAQLIDLGNISLADLDAPFVAGIDKPRVFIQSGSTLLWRRRDS
jgi:hypothetical protein